MIRISDMITYPMRDFSLGGRLVVAQMIYKSVYGMKEQIEQMIYEMRERMECKASNPPPYYHMLPHPTAYHGITSHDIPWYHILKSLDNHVKNVIISIYHIVKERSQT